MTSSIIFPSVLFDSEITFLEGGFGVFCLGWSAPCRQDNVFYIRKQFSKFNQSRNNSINKPNWGDKITEEETFICMFASHLHVLN